MDLLVLQAELCLASGTKEVHLRPVENYTANEPRELERLARVRHLAVSGGAAAIRMRAQVSSVEVGGAVGVDHVTVLRWEKGRRRPSGAAALRYLEVLEA